MKLKKLTYLGLMATSMAFADNNSLYNDAVQAGKNKQFNLNLNSNSTIDSYGQAESFHSTIANQANAGNANAQGMHNNVYGEDANPNYLYNEGTKEISACQGKDDARCTTLNKYGDRDTQTGLQAYGHGVSTKYYISVKPDPINSACSIVTRKVPINQTNESCISSNNSHTSCNATISISLKSHECDEQKGECNTYKNNPQCKQTKPYIAGECKEYSYSAHYGSCLVNTYTCKAGEMISTPGCGGSGGRGYVCGNCQSGGQGSFDADGCWNNTCINKIESQPAVYSCKVINYIDGCSGLKK